MLVRVDVELSWILRARGPFGGATGLYTGNKLVDDLSGLFDYLVDRFFYGR